MDDVLGRLSRIAPTTLGHFLDEGFLDPAIRPVYRPITLVGRALTVDSPPRDNSILRRAVQEAKRDDVLVVHRRGDERHAAFGGLWGDQGAAARAYVRGYDRFPGPLGRYAGYALAETWLAR